MGRNVFVSFRFNDGNEYKEKICNILKQKSISFDYSEDENRSNMSPDTIRKYLYNKLKEVGVVIILLTHNALYYKKDWSGKYDDWCYDEVRYALEDRTDNRTKGLLAIYTPEVEGEILESNIHKCYVCGKEKSVNTINDFEHLFRKNMMNIKPEYKTNKCPGIYDSLLDSYCSLVSYEEFKKEPDKYIENAFKKKEEVYKFTITKKL